MANSATNEFAHVRSYIDACLKPSSAPASLVGNLTTDSKKLLSIIEKFERTLPPDRDLTFPPFIALEPPNLRGVKRKKHPKILLAWSKRNQLQRKQHEQRKQIFLRRHRAEIEAQDDIAFKRRALERLRRDIQNNTISGTLVVTEKVNWVILPAGEGAVGYLRQYCHELATRYRAARSDFNRIEQVYALEPGAAYRGIDEFDGYLIFYFPEVRKAVLECPVVGNAIYIIEGEWNSLSRLSKSQLRRFHSDRVWRVIHTDGWFDRLKRHMRKRRI